MQQLQLLQLPLPTPKAPAATEPAAVGTLSFRLYDINRDSRRIADLLAARLGALVKLRFTSHSATLASYRHGQGSIMVRLHHVFRLADGPALDKIADFISGRTKAKEGLARFLLTHRAVLKDIPKPLPLVKGTSHNIAALFRQVNSTYFHDGCRAAVGFVCPGANAYKQRARLANYSPLYHAIAVCRALDCEQVPAFYLQWLLFKTILREIYVSSSGSWGMGQKKIEIKILETCFADYEAARQWEQQHLPAVLKAYKPRAKRQGYWRLPRNLWD